MATTGKQPPVAVPIQDVIDSVSDKLRMSAGITACEAREADFTSELEMKLTGIAMVPAARALMTTTLTDWWNRPERVLSPDIARSLRTREVIIGAGYSAAVYAAARVLAGFPKPVVLERGPARAIGGTFAMSTEPVFYLNSRSRPGPAGLPDQDKSLNYLPAGAGVPQLSMLTSQEYADNALLAWLIRCLLAQYADVYPNVTVTAIRTPPGDYRPTVVTDAAGEFTAGRAIDARGTGDPTSAPEPNGSTIMTFRQLMTRMGGAGGMFPLRGLRQVAIIGGGNSGLCAAESFLGLAPGNSSVIGLDYVERVDLYATTIDGTTCAAFREAQRGRYMKLAQYLDGNVSSPTARLRVFGRNGFAAPMPGGVLVNDRTYDMAVVCTGDRLNPLAITGTSFFDVRATGSSSSRATVLARRADPYDIVKIGPAADMPFSLNETEAGIDAIPANRVAMFRLGPRIAALAALLKPVT